MRSVPRTIRARPPRACTPAGSSAPWAGGDPHRHDERNGGGWFGPDSPFGGVKESGIGREHGVAGFEEYLQTKTIGYPV
jgi:hypothetical protein